MTFKKVFGEHEDLVISFLNSLLPFESEDELIKSVEYLNPELVPLNPLKKDSIVDVRCKDSRGRQFIVEMQMMWTSEYKQRVLFNASKAYVSQLECGQDYDLLHPVYSLNMVNDIYSDSEDYYHDYRIVEIAETNEVIEGLRFIFIELPKFTPKNYGDKKMQVLWLRYLTEINSRTRVVSEELTSNPVINKAVAQLEVSAFSDAQLLGYDRFWDMVSTAKMQISSSRKEGFRRGHKEGLEAGMKEGLEKGMKEGMEKGMEKGMEEGMKEGMKEGMEKGMKQGKKEGMREERIKNARGMKAEGIADEIIARVTGLTPEEMAALQ